MKKEKEEVQEKESLMDKEDRFIEKCVDELNAEPKLLDNPKAADFIAAVAKFQDSRIKAKEYDLSFIGAKIRTKLGLIEVAIKTGLTAIFLWLEIKKGTIFSGFMTKGVLGALFRKDSL